MDKIKWIIFAVIVVLVFGGIIWFSKKDSVTYTGDATQIITEGPIADHVKGTDAQKVTLIEYGDFQCPGCANMAASVKEFMQEFEGEVTFIYRHLPLTNIHPNALAAATAAEAAGMQGKFFEMHDMLFMTQQSWGSASISERTQIFENYAQQIGLDIEKYKTDLTSSNIPTKIDRDIYTGRQVFKANSTPTFVLNGEKVDSSIATNAAELRKLIEKAIANAYPEKQAAPNNEPQKPEED